MTNKTLFLILLAFVLVTAKGPQVNLEARKYGKISGRVVDEITGEGVEGIIVCINFERWQVYTGKNGRFQFKMIPDGEFIIRILIDKEPYFTKLHELKVRKEKAKDLTLKDVVARRGGAIEGTIKRWDGKPAPYMAVTVLAENENPGVYGATPDKNGHYYVSKLPPGTDLKVIACCWNVSRGCGRLVKEGVRVKREKTTKPVNFVIPDNPTEICGKVTSQEGEPLQAHLIFWKGAEDMGKILCDSNGNYSIRALEPGTYRVHVGYGCPEMKICGDKMIEVQRGRRIRMDIIISKKRIEFKENGNADHNTMIADNSIPEMKKERPLTPFMFSRNEAYDERLKDMILDAYLSDVWIKANSECLHDGNPQSIRTKMLNRLSDASNPIYIIIEDDDRVRIKAHRLKYYRLTSCGGTPKGSNFIYFFPAAFTEECGSLASVIFHELLHVVGFGDEIAYMSTKECYGKEVPEHPWSVKK